MAKLQKYLFDLDFAQNNPRPTVAEAMGLEGIADGAIPGLEAAMPPEQMVPEEPPPPPPPSFSEADLQTAREASFAEGRQAGLQEMAASVEHLTAAALNAMAGQLNSLSAAQQAANEARLREAVAVAVAVVRKLQPEWSRQHGLAEIEGLVQECLAQIDQDTRVTVRVNPDLLDGVKACGKRAAEATAFEGRLVYSADPRIAPGDCRVEWGDGGAERDQRRIWAEIDMVIGRALGTGRAAADADAAQDDAGQDGPRQDGALSA